MIGRTRQDVLSEVMNTKVGQRASRGRVMSLPLSGLRHADVCRYQGIRPCARLSQDRHGVIGVFAPAERVPGLRSNQALSEPLGSESGGFPAVRGDG